MFDGLGDPTPTYLKPKKSRTDPGIDKSDRIFELNLSYFLSRSQGTETECHAQRNTLLRQAIYVDPGILRLLRKGSSPTSSANVSKHIRLR